MGKQNIGGSTALNNWQQNLEMMDTGAIDSGVFLYRLLHTCVLEGVPIIWLCSNAPLSSISLPVCCKMVGEVL